MTTRIAALDWQQTTQDLHSRACIVSCDFATDSVFDITIQGTDSTGANVRPRYVYIDNLQSATQVEIEYSLFAMHVSPYTRTRFSLPTRLDNLKVIIQSGIVNVILAEIDLGIPDEQNQLASGQIFNMGQYANRAAIAAIPTPASGVSVYLLEQGRQGIFSFSNSDLSAFVAVDSRQGLYIGPDTDPSGSHGAWVRQRDNDEIFMRWFGTGTDDENVAALRGAIGIATINTKGIIRLTATTLSLSSSALAAATITVSENTHIIGYGKELSRLEITGGDICNLFTSINAGNIRFEDFTCTGNSQADNYTNGAFWINYLTDAAGVVDTVNLQIRSIHLENFKAPFWIDIENQNTLGAEIRTIVVDDLSAISKPGNLFGIPITFNSAVLHVSGFAGPVRDFTFTNFYADAEYIKQGFFIHNDVQDYHLSDIIVQDAGVNLATNDKGSYAGLIYDPTLSGGKGTINGFIALNPWSCGLYFANGVTVEVDQWIVSGQVDTDNTSLTKGAIAINEATRVILSNGICDGNVWDVAFSPNRANEDQKLIIDGIISTNGTQGIFIDYQQNGTIIHRGLRITNFDLDCSVRCIAIRGHNNSGAPGDTDHYWVDAIISNGVARSGNRTLDYYYDQANKNQVITSDVKIVGTSNSIYADTNTGLLIWNNVTIDNEQNAAAFDFQVVNCSNIIINGLDILNGHPASTAIDTAGSIGLQIGIRQIGSAGAIFAGSIGLAIPTNAAQNGNYVQKLTVAEAGGAGSKYVIHGYICTGGATWLEDRRLTGN